ncbi:MAG TPA: SPFH domain-containing protein, partial [Anaerolineales bacterium]|nr:SPFH domain-containing protein [Anaerolineales bacterium]
MKNRLPALGRSVRILLIVVVVLIVFTAVILPFANQFYYLFARVDQNQVGVRFQGGKILDVVGPGVYSDFGFFVEIKTVSSQAVPFSVRDEEIITSDKQRIGLVVSGDVFRPDLARRDLLLTLWPQYGNIYVDDELTKTRVQDLARQAMKVCVGERTFDDAIIGDARDDLRACIDDELSQLAENYGLQIENVVVPEVVLSPEVQAALDSIVQSRLATEKAAQDKANADAEVGQFT